MAALETAEAEAGPEAAAGAGAVSTARLPLARPIGLLSATAACVTAALLLFALPRFGTGRTAGASVARADDCGRPADLRFRPTVAGDARFAIAEAALATALPALLRGIPEEVRFVAKLYCRVQHSTVCKEAH